MDVRFRLRRDFTGQALEVESKFDVSSFVSSTATGTIINALRPIGLLTIMILAVAGPPDLSAQADDDGQADWADTIADLSSPHAVTRDKARNQLRSAGLGAFDAMLLMLPSARSDQRLSLEQLLLELDGRWLRLLKDETASEILKDFQTLSLSERFARTKLAGVFITDANLADLVWICRFELDESLTRLAAAVLLKRLNALDEAAREQINRQIIANCRESPRVACQWLRAVTTTVPVAPPDITRWVADESERLTDSDAIVSQSTFALLIAVTRLREHHSRQGGPSRWRSNEPVTFNSPIANTRQSNTPSQNPNIEILSDVTERLLVEKCPIRRLPEFMDTLLTFHRFQAAETVLERHSNAFRTNSQLAVRAAQFYMLLGNSVNADEFILGIRERLERAATGQIEVVAIALQLGYSPVAERLLCQLIATPDLELDRQTQARLILAELLGQDQRPSEAAACLEPLIQTVHAESGAEGKSGKLAINDRNLLVGRWCFYRSEAERIQGDYMAQNYWLVRGLQSDPRSSDLLISALRANSQPSRVRQVTMDLIALRCEELTIEIARLSERLESTPERDEVYRTRRQLTTQLNRLAWLMCCTRQSPRRAIELAERAVALDPNNPSAHDTLARCHFSAGNLSAATVSARSAHRLAPSNSTYASNLTFYQSVPSTDLLASRDDVLVEVR